MLERVTLSGVTGGERDAVGAEGFKETRAQQRPTDLTEQRAGDNMQSCALETGSGCDR